jgi:hypothetical protein
MMNGVLMTAGVDAVSIPAVRAAEFNSRMVDFYTSRDATEMMAFVLDCHPEISKIRRLNPGILGVRDLPGIKYYGLSDSIEQTRQSVQSTDEVGRGAAADLEAMPVGKQQTRAPSLEETRRQARESWRRDYYDKRADQLEPQTDSNHAKEHADEDTTPAERDAGLDFDPER